MTSLLLALLLLAAPGLAHAMLITEWSTEYVFLYQQIGTPTDPTERLNVFLQENRELVYEVSEAGVATLVSSRELSWEEYAKGMPTISGPIVTTTTGGGPVTSGNSNLSGSAQPTETPDPATIFMVGVSAVAVGWWKRRRR